MHSKKDVQEKTTVLLEMRPALEGFAGIPQECRLLFRGLRMVEFIEVEGLLQTSHRTLASGTIAKSGFFTPMMSGSKKINRYSRVIVSLAEKPYRTIFDKGADWIQKGVASAGLTLSSLFSLKKIKLSKFESRYFEDFVWRTLFSKTLPASDFSLVANANLRICSVPWHGMHVAGLNTLNFLPAPRYPRLDTTGVDVFIAQTPYPARVSPRTAFVVRYHDALPIFMPHTISDKSLHQATHFYALMDNVTSGAYIACVSEATRKDLISLFPGAEKRAVTIHNMVSHHYVLEDSAPELVPGIVRARIYEGADLLPKFFSLREKENFYRHCLGKSPFKYLLIVSTVEPRKNHLRLLAAWEVLKADLDPNIKLVVVGTLGWDYGPIVKAFRTWIDRGELFMLSSVPAPDLRVLYRHAAATVCPSLGEGFDFSGVESMRSGGVVIASDIPVHREIYDDASEYFDPYSTASLVNALKKVLYASSSKDVQETLRAQGQAVSERYLPEKILPQWEDFLERVLAEKS